MNSLMVCSYHILYSVSFKAEIHIRHWDVHEKLDFLLPIASCEWEGSKLEQTHKPAVRVHGLSITLILVPVFPSSSAHLTRFTYNLYSRVRKYKEFKELKKIFTVYGYTITLKGRSSKIDAYLFGLNFSYKLCK